MFNDFSPTINFFREFLAHNLAKSQYFSMRPILFHNYYQITYNLKAWLNISKMWILYQKTLKNFSKSAISPFALFVQSWSLKKHHVLHFLIFSLEILNTASQLNLAANVLDFWISTLAPFWLNFPENVAKIAPKLCQSRNLKIRLESYLPNLVEKLYSNFQAKILKKCWTWCFFSDRDWTKSAHEDMANFVKFLFFGYKIHIFWDIELKLSDNMSFDSSNRINVVSLTNIEIWPSYGPKIL